MVRLGELVESSILKRKLSGDDLVTFVGMQDLSEDGALKTQHVKKHQEIKAGLTYFERNDVLVAKITPCFENGKGANLNKLETLVGYGSTEFHVLRAKQGCDPGYIYQHTISSKFRRSLESEMVGTAGHRRVPLSAVEDFELLIMHSSAEQKSIAKALTDVDELIVSLQKLIAKKRDIKIATMQQLLTGKKRLPGFGEGKGYKQTELGEMPEDWEPNKLKKLGDTYGGLTGKSKKDFSAGNSHYITFMNVMSNIVIDVDLFDRVNIDKNERQNTVMYGDLLFNGSSETPEELALCSLLDKNIPDLYLNSFCFGFRLNEELQVSPLFVAYLFRCNNGRKLLSALAQGSTRYNISKSKFLELILYLPDFDEQVAINQILSDMHAELFELNSKLTKTQQLKQGMMQELLTGRTRLVDVSEPLLEASSV